MARQGQIVEVGDQGRSSLINTSRPWRQASPLIRASATSGGASAGASSHQRGVQAGSAPVKSVRRHRAKAGSSPGHQPSAASAWPAPGRSASRGYRRAPQGQLRLPAQHIVEGREGTHRRRGHGRHVGAKGDRSGAQRLGQEHAVHVVLQGGGRHLGDVIARPLGPQQAGKGLQVIRAGMASTTSTVRSGKSAASCARLTCGQIIPSRERRPTRCWLRIQMPRSGAGGFTKRMSTAPGGRSAAWPSRASSAREAHGTRRRAAPLAGRARALGPAHPAALMSASARAWRWLSSPRTRINTQNRTSCRPNRMSIAPAVR